MSLAGKTMVRGAVIATQQPMRKRIDVASSSDGITGWLARWNDGDETAFEKLVPLVYQELHRLASGYMRGERSGHLLQTTALVNEAYLRLHDANRIHWAGSESLLRGCGTSHATGPGRIRPGAETTQATWRASGLVG
jgi:hypothetical protein